MADKTQILREMRERNYNAAKGKATPRAKSIQIEELKKIADETPQPEKKKRGRKPGAKNIPAVTPEKKKRGPRGPYKKRSK